MKKEELIQYHEYWREHLDEFVEEVFGLKLFPYQKEIIKVICASQTNKFDQEKYEETDRR